MPQWLRYTTPLPHLTTPIWCGYSLEGPWCHYMFLNICFWNAYTWKILTLFWKKKHLLPPQNMKLFKTRGCPPPCLAHPPTHKHLPCFWKASNMRKQLLVFWSCLSLQNCDKIFKCMLYFHKINLCPIKNNHNSLFQLQKECLQDWADSVWKHQAFDCVQFFYWPLVVSSS